MKRTLLTLLAASSLSVAAPVIAQAQPWLPIGQREAALDARIDAGARSGALTNSEAANLRSEFAAILRLEGDYRRSAPGLTGNEMRELDRRFDILSNRIATEVADNDRGRWDRDDRDNDRHRAGNFDERRADLERRIAQGMRSGQLTRNEAADLRREMVRLDRLEDQYRGNDGRLNRSERAELDRRYDRLADNLHDSRTDRDRSWDNIQALRAQLDRRIDRAWRDNRLTRTEADRLHAEAAALVRLEAQYRASAPGVTRSERAELDRRADLIETRIGDNINLGYGYGR